MNRIDDSYEGAVTRLRHIEAARAQVPPPPIPGRMRDLEQLAQLACEENDRLELELVQLRDENASLRRRLAALQETIADPRAVLGLPALSRDPPDPPRASAPSSSGGLFLGGFVLALLAAPLAYLATQPPPDSAWHVLARDPVAAARAHLGPLLTSARPQLEALVHGPIPLLWRDDTAR